MNTCRFWNSCWFYPFVLSLILGAFWMSSGISKGIQLLFITNMTQQTLSIWTDQFPAMLVYAAIGFEILIAFALLFGPRHAGLVGGLFLLSVYSIALMVYPLQPAQSCGCDGAAQIAHDMPLVRNAVLAGIHFLTLSLSVSPTRHSTSLNKAHAAMP